MSDDARKCLGCGADVGDDAMFCPRCGQDVTLVGDETPTLAVTTAGTPVQPVRSTMRQALRDATLGEYEILSELGRGGMATVFLAHDIALDRKVAIKVMAPHLLEGEGMAERFKLEARTAAQLSQPHIIPIYAVKETAETLYFVMKYVEGRGLDAVIKKTGQLPIPMVKDILTKVGNALSYAHRRDVVHRDIKPANIMIDEEGEPVVTDFGIAKVAATKGLTITGTTIGTPSYMSPEQCEAKQVTGASDQYSLGIVAFEMLTGKLPFEGDSAVTTMYKHCHEPLPPLEDFRPDCPSEMRETISRMVAKVPADRWPSLEAAVRKLNNDPTPTDVDPVRSQLMELMKGGDSEEILARLSDPSGPVTRSTTGPGAVAAAPPRSRAGLYAAVAVAVLAIGGTVAVMQPWAGGATTAPGTAGSGTPASGQPATGDPAGGGVEPTGGAPQPETGGATPTGGTAGNAGSTPPVVEPTTPPAGGAGQRGRGANPSGGSGAVARPTVQTVLISGVPASLEPGQSATLTATAVDASGFAVPGATSLTWVSSDQRIARVDPNGRVEALAAGSVGITASAGGVSGVVDLLVTEGAVTAVALDQSDLELTVGDEATLSAQPRGFQGDLAGRSVGWRSSDTDVVTVTGGRVSAEGAGTATITASSEGASAQASVTVRIATRAAVEAVVAAYAEAYESRDVNRVRSVYPGLSPAAASSLQDTFAPLDALRVEWAIESLDEQAQTAVADVQATYHFVERGRDTAVPVSLLFTFTRTTTGWNLSQVQNRQGG